MILPRLCISAPSGGGGKTLLTLGLGRVWHQDGISVKPFKKGPDYIDSAWLGAACGSAATNLDPWFLDSEQILQLFLTSAEGHDLALLEGNRGLFDGVDPEGSCSTAQVARAIQCPILLCVDCSKTTRTAAAIISGLVNFEPGLQFMGVVLNRVGSSRHEQALIKAIEANTTLPILGCLPRMEQNPVPERHMGLVPAERGEKLDKILDGLADRVRKGCDTAKILQLAAEAPPLPKPARENRAKPVCRAKTPVLGVVCDRAFWFYYPENLQSLENAGCRLVHISLLDDSPNPANFDGIYLGGGFPEDYLEELSQSASLHSLPALCKEGMPVYAECGGLMILCRTITRQGRAWPMANVFSADVRWVQRPQGLGYVGGEAEVENPWFPRGLAIRGHEFHYSKCEWPGPPPQLALRLSRGVGVWQDENGIMWDGLILRNTWASYTHIFAPAVPHWAGRFAELAVGREAMGW